MPGAEIRCNPALAPEISVVIPVRNRAALLARALESLVGQEVDPHSFEIVVCNDGSTEDLGSVIRHFQLGPTAIRLLSQEPRGPAAARNLGVRSTRTPVIIFLDSDVIADKNLIARLKLALANNPQWAGAEAALIPTDGCQGPLWDAPASGAGGRFHTAAIAYRRTALETVGGLDETFKLPACEDVELAVRILKQGSIGFVPEAKVFHSRRRVALQTHWHGRRQWKYLVILAKRYGVLAFPGHQVGKFPRLRVALAAVVTLPAGRFREAVRHMKQEVAEGALACIHAGFAVFCGLCALPEILTVDIPKRQRYL